MKQRRQGQKLPWWVIALIVLLIMGIIGSFLPEDKEETEEVKPKKQEESVEKPKKTIKKKDGFDILQSLYLQIDENDTEEKIAQIVEDNGLYMNVATYGGPFETIYISQTKTTGMGGGAETWYKYKTDSISLWMTEDDGKLRVSNKDYRVQDKYITVEYTFYNKEILTKNSIAGYTEGDGKEKTDWDSLEEALKYAKDK